MATTHQVVSGETLSSIALKYYGRGDEAHWMKIYNANKGVIGSDPNILMTKDVYGQDVFPVLSIPE